MSTITSAFIDLATYDELDKYMYGGEDSTAYFVRETRKATWFSQVPVPLQVNTGSAAFGGKWGVNISRSGDYLLGAWLRLTVGAISVPVGGTAGDDCVRWTRNLAHNLIKSVSVQFNQMEAQKFDNIGLDFWAAFTVPAAKQAAYDTMIGNTENMCKGVLNIASGSATTNDAQVLNLPLPFFFARDTGVSLPTAAIPYNEMSIQFEFRKASELLVNMSEATPAVYKALPATMAMPTLSDVQVWGNYAIVSNEERKRMACAPRDVLIEQVQVANALKFDAAAEDAQTQVNLRFNHAIKLLMFGVRQIGPLSGAAEWSNYSTDQVDRGGAAAFATYPYAGLANTGGMNSGAMLTKDPIKLVTLQYEGNNRLNVMNADYFSLTQPMYQPGATIPNSVGYHMYSYSLDFLNTDPMGSTNYGKLTNVSLLATASAAAATANALAAADKFELYVVAINNNVIRISGGAMGFPVV